MAIFPDASNSSAKIDLFEKWWLSHRKNSGLIILDSRLENTQLNVQNRFSFLNANFLFGFRPYFIRISSRQATTLMLTYLYQFAGDEFNFILSKISYSSESGWPLERIAVALATTIIDQNFLSLMLHSRFRWNHGCPNSLMLCVRLNIFEDLNRLCLRIFFIKRGRFVTPSLGKMLLLLQQSQVGV